LISQFPFVVVVVRILTKISMFPAPAQMLPLNTNIRLAYANGKDDEQNFIQNLSLFLCTFLKEHGQLIEKRLNLRETLMEVREDAVSQRCGGKEGNECVRPSKKGSPI